MYRVIKFTGALGGNNTVTIAPNTTKVFLIIINATTDSGSSGPYSVILTQGSGANITVQNGNNAVIYCDGAGSGAVVTDALSDLQIGDDLSLVSDSAVINMGADNDVTITHVADTGLKLKQAGATGDGKPFILTLQTGELDIAAADVLGQIDFQAPDEATGTDAILVAAGIAAISEGDFSSSSNATKLSFKTAVTAAAAETMFLSSAGNLDVTGDITGSTVNADGDTAAGDNAAMGYTAGEGLILTGQGSTNDITIKNDADADVLTIPTGATGVVLAGALTTGGTTTLGGAIAGADNQVGRVNLIDYGEVTNAIGATGGGTQDIDLTLGNSVSATVDTNTNTFTFSNPTASDEMCGFSLVLTNGGSQTVVWPGAVDWAGGTAPTLTASGVDILIFITIDGGTIWHGMAASTDSKSP
jgi:filamentous hemagglutinin